MTTQLILIIRILLLPVTMSLLSSDDHHLVRCITNISVRHFTPGRSLVLSMLPDVDTELRTELMMQLHEANLWSVILHPFEHEDDFDMTNYIHSSGSFIIYLTFSCTERGIGDTKLFGQVRDLYMAGKRYVPVWSCEARVILAAVFKCKTPKFDRHLVDLFKFMFYRKITNSVIIINSQDSKEFKSHKRINVYAHFPYKKPHQCHLTKASHITLMDSWVVDGDGYFINNNDLFPKRSFRNLNGCPLRAIIRQVTYLLDIEFEQTNPAQIIGASGLEIELYKVITTTMNATLYYHDNVPSFNNVTRPEARDVATMLVQNKADVVFGGVGECFQQTSIFETTKIYKSENYRWFVPCAIKAPKAGRILKILSYSLWIAIAATLVAVALAMVYLAKKVPGVSEWKIYKSLGSSLTIVWAVILGVSASKLPRTLPLSLFFLSWVYFSLCFNTAFQTVLTMYLIEPGYEPPLRDMDQLLSSGLPLTHLQVYDLLYKWHRDSHVISEKTVLCFTNHHCLDWIANYRNVSVLVGDSYVEELYSLGMLTDESNKRLVCGLDDGIMKNQRYGMFMLLRNPLLSEINDIITRIIESGIFDHWEKVFLNLEKLRRRLSVVQKSKEKFDSFSLTHLSAAFVLLLFGYILSLLLLLVEKQYYRCYQYIKIPSQSSVLSK